MDLKPFTKDDWDGFAGCDTRFPFITDEDIHLEGEPEFTYICLAVVDGPVVQFHGSLDDDDSKEILLHKEFGSTGEAITYVMKMHHTVKVDDLIHVDGFKVIS